MRLICPNCGAQYEVPVDAIPVGGRDVQCSGCGHTWFQLHPQDALEDREENGQEDAQDEERAPEPRFEPEAPLPSDDLWEEMDEAAPDQSLATDESEHEPEDAPEPAATPVPRRPVRARGLDPSVAEVLRQEAAREARRRTDADPLESQPDLGLGVPAEEEAAHRARVARAHMSRIRGDAPLAEDVAPEPDQIPAGPGETSPGETSDIVTSEPEHPAATVSRRDLLPDIEEINQNLRVAPAPPRMETPQGRALHAEEEEQQGSNFARGFGAALILAVLAVLLYALAPAISTAVPAAAPLLDPYVGTVDGMRLWLDAQLAALLS